MKHYLYQLKLIDRLRSESGWTAEDNATVGRHFQHLKALTEAGVVLLAGKTDREMADGFGIVLFAAENETAAEAIMLSDPAIVGGIMTGVLFNYKIGLKGAL